MTKKLKNLISFTLFCLVRQATTFAFNPSEEQLISARSGAILNYTAPTANQPQRSKNQVVVNFCKQSLNPNMANLFNDDDDLYSAQQSLFLSLLCSHTQEKFATAFHPGIRSDNENNYLKKEIWFQTLNYAGECQEKYPENCNLADIANQLITDILSDLTILKQGNLYGIISNNLTDEKDRKHAANLFAEKQLNIWKADDLQTNFCDWKQHSYPKTCSIITKSLESFKKAYANLKIIDTTELLKDSKDKISNKNLCTKNKTQPLTFDALLCNTFWTLEKERGLLPFTSQVYNELLRYTLFSSYYLYNLEIKTQPTPQDLEEIAELKSQPSIFLNTINKTIKQLNDIQSSYPIHIWMLSYQEDLLRLRDQYLSKIITPIYTIFHKVQNVQVSK